MSDRVPAEVFPAGEYLKDELDERGWTQAEFAAITGRPVAVVNQIISGKRGITPETAAEIGAALGTSALYWMNLDAAYRVWKAGPVSPRIRSQARIRERFPVREMEKRGWLEKSENSEVLESQLLRYFGIASIEDQPKLAHAAKKTGYPKDISGTQLAWLFRVKQIAEAMTLPAYSEKALRAALSELQQLLLAPEEIRHVPRILAECGVRFVVVEHVPSSKIDGVCFWLDRNTPSPVIGMSLRRDKIDNFWFVLRHEIEHVLNKDGRDEAIVDQDSDNAEGGAAIAVSEEERLANEAGADFCVPKAEMDDFVLRNRPLFSEEKVLNFARRVQVHPGLVVGQLQRRLGNYRLFHQHLVKVRPIIAPIAMTDGYGQAVPIRL